MTLSDLASVGSLVSGVAVLISLVYLAIQVKQAEKNQRALMQQGRADRVSLNTLMIAEGELAQIFLKGMRGDEDLPPEEIERFMLVCRATFVSAEDSYLQHLSGQLDGTAFRSFVTGVRGAFFQPGLRAAWRMTSNQYGEEFVRFMDGLMNETEAGPPSDRPAKWLETVKSEKSRTKPDAQSRAFP